MPDSLSSRAQRATFSCGVKGPSLAVLSEPLELHQRKRRVGQAWTPPNCRRVSDTLAVCRDRLNFEYEFRQE
jgi:hypothetical protein